MAIRQLVREWPYHQSGTGHHDWGSALEQWNRYSGPFERVRHWMDGGS